MRFLPITCLVLILATAPAAAAGPVPRNVLDGPGGILHYGDVEGERLRYVRSPDGGVTWEAEEIPGRAQPLARKHPELRHQRQREMGPRGRRARPRKKREVDGTL